ncbi:MAG: hypothetical protein LBG13_01210 [Holosporales bacterium]|jgi:hypothetical protein|nr:hypothetical protein [Holosporales bacterium]
MKKELIAGLLTRGAVVLLACGAVPCCQAMSEEASSSSRALVKDWQQQEIPLSAEQQQKIRQEAQTLCAKLELAGKFGGKNKEFLKEEAPRVVSFGDALGFIGRFVE